MRVSIRLILVDERGAKAAIYNLNRIGQRPAELEEAWIVHALVREDGLAQVEAGQLLGRHKSWVNRRLALLERLCDEAREELRLGLLTPSLARQLTRLPRGNQAEALTTVREAALTSRELSGVFQLSCTAAAGVGLATLEAAVREEVGALAADGPSEAELSRALAQTEAQFIYRLQTIGGFGGTCYAEGRPSVLVAPKVALDRVG